MSSINPYGNIPPYSSVAQWDVTPDTWEHSEIEGFTITKHLLKTSNQIFNVVGNTLNLLSITEPLTVENYEEFGLNGVEEFPIDELNQLNEFEILSYTDKTHIIEVNPTSTIETVDSGKLFKTTIEDFIDITNIELT